MAHRAWLRPEDPPWLAEALQVMDRRDEIGLEDGRRRLRLLAWANRRLPVHLPWCGLFVGHCLDETVPEAGLPWCHKRARPWLGWGVPCPPRRGAVAVFWLVARPSPFGHVGFVWEERDSHLIVLGGNQRHAIRLARWPKAKLLGCRWPATDQTRA